MASLPISKKKARDIIESNAGRFFSATFVKKDGTKRTITCRYMGDMHNKQLGYITVEDMVLKKITTNYIRSINMQTIKSLKIQGVNYIVR